MSPPAHYDEESALWEVETDQAERLRTRFCIMATGCLSAARMPDIAGIKEFEGATYHTGLWPHEGTPRSTRRKPSRT